MTNEIRVGSWLFGSGGIKRKVTADVIQKAVDSVRIKASMPIPLKEEMLMKTTPMVQLPNNKAAFDFVNGPWIMRLLKVDYYWSVHLAFVKPSTDPVGIPFYPHLRDIEYVHQLQNLILDLFGIEIEIEP